MRNRPHTTTVMQYLHNTLSAVASLRPGKRTESVSPYITVFCFASARSSRRQNVTEEFDLFKSYSRMRGWLYYSEDVIWEVTPCGLVEAHHTFRRTCCLHHQDID
jgi:hypothetical protein